jgi:hypothetical protein
VNRVYEYKNLIGQKFGRLTVIEYAGKGLTKDRTSRWLCRCDCGNEKIVTRLNLINNYTKSCGCLLNGDKLYKGIITAENTLFRNYKTNAKNRNISFELTKEEFIDLVHKPCNYDGHIDQKGTEYREETFALNGIDRVDNTKGYTLDNCVPCCSKCNLAKREMTKDEFINWISDVYNYTREKDS